VNLFFVAIKMFIFDSFLTLGFSLKFECVKWLDYFLLFNLDGKLIDRLVIVF
jgi:hypothetical protein